MLSWMIAFVVTGVPLNFPDGAHIAPTEIVQGQQNVPLRGPLVARTAGARLVLFVRELDELTANEADRNNAFEQAVPTGSVSALLSREDGPQLHLEHTGYIYYRGFAGLVLTETSPGQRRQRYDQLELTAQRDLPLVRFVWLDQLTRTVRDVPPPR